MSQPTANLKRPSFLFIGLLLFLHSPVQSQYPYNIDMYHTMIGNATIVAQHAVIHHPGFKVKTGLYYHAYIDPNFKGNGTPYDSPPDPGGLSITPSADKNYIITTTPQFITTPNQTTGFNPNGNNTSDKAFIDIVYYDGIGREQQDISVMATPGQNDLIKCFSYDIEGRKEKEFIPYEITSIQNHLIGAYDPNYETHQGNFINSLFDNEGSYGFVQYKYEQTPLNRLIKQSAPGHAWSFSNSSQEHVTEMNYQTNTSGISSFDNHGNTISYPSNSLFIETVENENENLNNVTNRNVKQTFKDKSGKLTMTESTDGTYPIQTRYIYDDLDRLFEILPPQATSPSNLLCYYYTHDSKNRIISKSIPGEGIQYFIYDSRDRLVMSQDAKMRVENANMWIMINYDTYNRIVMTGIYTSPIDEDFNGMQTLYDNNVTNNYINEEIDDNNTDLGYTLHVVNKLGGSSADYTVMMINYYDKYYSFFPLGFTFDNTNGLVSQSEQFSPVKDQITATKTRVVNGESMKDWIFKVNFYDDKYQIIQSIEDNQCLDGKDIISTQFSFSGRIEAQKTKHTAFSNTIEYTERFRYDYRGRIIEHTMEGDPTSEPIMLSKEKYNSLGQLCTKLIHSQSVSGTQEPFIQKIDYTYNIRGWLTGINDPENTSAKNDIFAMSLFYNNQLSGVTQQPQYNGNISAIKWKTNLKDDKYAYGYSYDALDRLLEGNLYFNTNGSFQNTDNSFCENNISYDLNGNITALKRYANNGLFIDDLHYNYDYAQHGNQFTYITDYQGDVPGVINYKGDQSNSIKYSYDANGNMIQDLTKGINNIVYSYLNKPEVIDFGNGEKIIFIYDGSGSKLAKEVIVNNELSNNSLIYIGNFVYNWVGTLQYILNDEGRLVPEGNSFRFEYFMKDHLRNTRATYAPACSGLAEVAEIHHYYPFGMELETLTYNSGADLQNTYLYNGKELQPDFGLLSYDYGARFYDPQLGRWHSVDPAAEVNRRWSPYTYALDNPVRFIDPDGMAVDDYYGRDATFLGHQGTGNTQRYIQASKYNEITKAGGGEKELNSPGVSSEINFQSNQTSFIDNIKSKTDEPLAGENGSLIIFNTTDESNPKVEFGEVTEGSSNNTVTHDYGTTQSDSHDGIPAGTKVANGNIHEVVIGEIHAHKDNIEPGVSTTSNRAGGNDKKVASDIQGPCYAIGKQGEVIHKVDQHCNVNNNIPRSSIDVLKDALKTHGRK